MKKILAKMFGPNLKYCHEGKSHCFHDHGKYAYPGSKDYHTHVKRCCHCSCQMQRGRKQLVDIGGHGQAHIKMRDIRHGDWEPWIVVGWPSLLP